MAYQEQKTINGVKTINYKGKSYVEVSERVRQIHEKDLTFEVLDSTFYEVAGRVICKVKVSVAGSVYHGQAEAKLLNAIPKSADDTNPFECAETSAVGRALAFAGLGTIDGIASFDEIARSVPLDQLQSAMQQTAPTDQQATTNEPTNINTAKQERAKTTSPSLEDVKNALSAANLIGPDNAYLDFRGLLAQAYKKEITGGKLNLEALVSGKTQIRSEGLKYLMQFIETLKTKAAI